MDEDPHDPMTTTGGGDDRPDAAASLSWMASPDAGAVPAPTVHVSAPPKKSRAGLVIASVVVVLIAAAGITVAATTGSHTSSPPAPSGSANQVVLTALDSTLGAKTADVHMSVVMTVPGAGQVTASGGGAIDFTNNAATMHFTYQGIPTLSGMTMTMLYTGGNIYLSMPQISEILPGKSWIDASTGGSSVAPGSNNPAAMFQMLQAQGDTVTPLGASVVNGQATQGYHVVISAASIQQAIAKEKVPGALAQEIQGMFGSSSISMDVYVGDANKMLVRVVVDMSMSVAGKSVVAKATEDTSNYGVPVNVTAPPADQVVSLSDFAQAASALTSGS